MNADDIRAYKKRWELVAEVEKQELDAMSPAKKFADLASLMSLARALDGATDAEKEVDQVRRRWNLLAERLGV